MPAKGLEDKVSANTHVDDLKRQTEIVRNNPLTYLNVVKPYLRFNEEKNPAKHFPYATASLHELIAEKAMYMDGNDSLYIYVQTDKINGFHEYIGLICTVPVEDYYEGRIRIHEKTITEKEEQLIMHIEHTGVIGEPVLMTHSSDPAITSVLRKFIASGEEIIHFHDEVDRIHRVIRISEPQAINEITSVYAGSGDLYIADGHHRSAASAGYFKKNKISNGHYLTYIVPPEFLHIDSFHRAYKAAQHFDRAEFLNLLKSDFEITECQESFEPENEREFGLLTGNQWYRLKYRHQTGKENAVDKLDVSILEEKVFKGKLNIQDSKTDKQLSFLKGNIPCRELEAEVKAGIYDAVFTVHPCTIQQVFDVADQGLIMPPKSTYIEPKLRTGLTVQKVHD